MCLVQTPLAQRLMMQESSLAQFALQSAASLPAITLGLPATASTRVGSQVLGSPQNWAEGPRQGRGSPFLWAWGPWGNARRCL